MSHWVVYQTIPTLKLFPLMYAIPQRQQLQVPMLGIQYHSIVSYHHWSQWAVWVPQPYQNSPMFPTQRDLTKLVFCSSCFELKTSPEALGYYYVKLCKCTSLAQEVKEGLVLLCYCLTDPQWEVWVGQLLCSIYKRSRHSIHLLGTCLKRTQIG